MATGITFGRILELGNILEKYNLTHLLHIGELKEVIWVNCSFHAFLATSFCALCLPIKVHSCYFLVIGGKNKT